jgi:hypothetical protein
VEDSDNSRQTPQGSLIDLVPAEQVGVVSEVSEGLTETFAKENSATDAFHGAKTRDPQEASSFCKLLEVKCLASIKTVASTCCISSRNPCEPISVIGNFDQLLLLAIRN